MLSMKTRYLYKFVEDFLFVDPSCGVISLRYRFDQFASGCQAELSPDSAARHVESSALARSWFSRNLRAR